MSAKSDIKLGKKLAYAHELDRAYGLLWKNRRDPAFDAEAQHLLGCVFHYREPPNFDKALTWFRKAAAQGYAASEFNIGRMYEVGRGVEASGEEAVKWYTSAAEHGDVDACFNLGHMYYNAHVVKRDDRRALRFFMRAAEKGHPKALFSLGVMSFEGAGVEQSDTEAIKWFMLAGEHGHERAQDAIKRVLAAGIAAPLAARRRRTSSKSASAKSSRTPSASRRLKTKN